MMGNEILCALAHVPCHTGACAPHPPAVGRGAIGMDVNEIKEEWMVTGKELGVQSGRSAGRRRECWSRSVLSDNISFFSFHKCLSCLPDRQPRLGSRGFRLYLFGLPVSFSDNSPRESHLLSEEEMEKRGVS